MSCFVGGKVGVKNRRKYEKVTAVLPDEKYASRK